MIALKSDYGEAHNNLGNTLEELGRLDEAANIYDLMQTTKQRMSLARRFLQWSLYFCMGDLVRCCFIRYSMGTLRLQLILMFTLKVGSE